MPATTQEISDAGLAALDYYLKNPPEDQIATARPLMDKLRSREQEFPGGKQYVVEQLRVTYASNFQWYYGAQAVTYNSRQTLKQSQFPWRGCHDGYFLDEDRLLRNGISMHDGARGNMSADERVALTDLVKEEATALLLGFDEKFDYDLHRDGTHNAEALAGIDALVSTTPAADATVGGLNGQDLTYWRNHAVGSLNSTTIIPAMETAWRACVRNGGAPDFILAGDDFIDIYRAALLAKGEYQMAPTGVQRFDGGVGMGTKGTETGLYFKGLPIVWDPVFADLDAALSPSIDYVDRCYFFNCRHMRLRPARGHNRINRTPPREYNRYVHYWAVTWKGALTINRRNAHAVLSVA